MDDPLMKYFNSGSSLSKTTLRKLMLVYTKHIVLFIRLVVFDSMLQLKAMD